MLDEPFKFEETYGEGSLRRGCFEVTCGQCYHWFNTLEYHVKAAKEAVRAAGWRKTKFGYRCKACIQKGILP